MRPHLILFAPIKGFAVLLAQGWRFSLDRWGCPELPRQHGEYSVMMWRRA